MGPGQSPGGDQAAKFPEAPRIQYSEITYFSLKYASFVVFFQLFFSKIRVRSKFQRTITFLTRQDPTYLQTAYHFVYYLKYSELQSFFGHRVWDAHTGMPASKSLWTRLYAYIVENHKTFNVI